MRLLYIMLCCFMAKVLSGISRLFIYSSKMDVKRAQSIVASIYPLCPLEKHFPPLLDVNSDIILSIIVPVYNAEAFIKRCVLSLLNQQTKYNYEVICINDGSTDNSLTILNSLLNKFPNRLIVVSQKNSGISVTRNRGIEMARGEYLSFIDNDDFVDDSYVEILIGKALEEKADMVQCGYTMNNIEGEIIRRDVLGQNVLILKKDSDLIKYVHGYIWGGVIKRDLFSHIRFPDGYWFEDIITRLVLMNLCNKVCIMNNDIYHKTIHNKNASSILWKKGNYKSIDQYYLTKELSKWFIKLNGGNSDLIQYNIVVEEFSAILKYRISGLPNKFQQAIFVLASDYIQSYPHTFYCFLDKDIQYEKYLRTKRYISWQILCWSDRFLNKSQWLRSKLENKKI